MTHGYYTAKLSAERLRRCYEVAPPRVQRYLRAEIDFVLSKMEPSARVLELGCGYGRVLQHLRARAGMVVGVDTSLDSLRLARRLLGHGPACHLLAMDAARPGLPNHCFDMVLCIQNGISAFKVDQRQLIQEGLRVTRPGGRVLLSSYADAFWEDRLEWFRRQADQGLIGEIDEKATGAGVIVCKDGFRASTVGPEAFVSLSAGLGVSVEVTEVDGSAIFCELQAA